MLLVFNCIAGDGFVAELAELDPDLVTCYPVGPASHDCPVSPRDGVLLRHCFHAFPARQNGAHLPRERLELLELPHDGLGGKRREQLCKVERQYRS